MNINPKRKGMTVFSGTDLKKNINNPGICFPFGAFEEIEKPTFGSIMLINNKNVVLCRTEYRTATQNNDTINYSKHRSCSFVSGDIKYPSTVEKMLGVQEEDSSYAITDNAPDQSVNIAKAVSDVLKKIEFKASTEFIDEANVSTISSSIDSILRGKTTKKSKEATKEVKLKKTKFVPARSSDEWKKVKNEIEDFFDVIILPYQMISAMTQKDRSKYYKDLHESVYMFTIEMNKNINTMDVIALQDKIWLETLDDMLKMEDMQSKDEEELTVDEMRQEIISWGVDKLEVATTPDEAIVKWHGDVMKEVEYDY